MRLTRLEIYGFKSFMNKLDLTFNSGITAIVGPNGCGKTNVVDAIRWVLGEQNPRLLRGRTMEDVIFNGTKTQRPLGMAEVSLSVSNEDHRLGTDLSEATVTRRVFRSGESEYLLNRAPCRLRDIGDLFMDSGLGTNAYSVIEREMLDAILDDTHGSRRALFEEAAGITGYKAREKSALRKLDATEQDLLRVGDIIAEVETHVRRLKRQVGKARRYKRLKGELQQLEVATLTARYEEVQKEIAKWEATLKELAKRREKLVADKARVEAEVEQLELQSLESQRRLSQAEGTLFETMSRMEMIEGERAVLKERATHLEDLRKRCQEEMETIQAFLSKSAQEDEDLKKRGGNLAEEEERLTKKVSELRQRRDELGAKRESALSELHEKREREKELLKVLSSTREELGAERAALEEMRGQSAALAEDLESLKGDAAERERDLARMQREAEVCAKRVEVAREEEDRRGTEVSQIDKAFETFELELKTLAQQRTRLESQIEILRGLEEKFEGFRSGVQEVLREKGSFEGVIGPLADFVTCRDRQYAPAVEAALEGVLEYLLASDLAGATRALDHLRRGDLGRATFVLLDAVQESKEQAPTSTADEALLREEGIVASVADVVEVGDERTGRLLHTLLEGSVIVSDMEIALRLKDRLFERSLTAVTLEGEVLAPPGLLTGGREGEEGILRRRERLVLLEDELEKLLQKHEEMATRERQLLEERAATGATREMAKAQREMREEEYSTKQRALDLAEAELARNKESLTRLGHEAEMLSARIAGRAEGAQGLEQREENERQTYQSAVSEAEEAGEALEALQRGLTSAGDRLSSFEKKLLEVSSELRELGRERERLEARVKERSAQLEMRKQEAGGHDERSQKIKRDLEEAEVELKKLETQRLDRQRDRDERASAHGNLQESLRAGVGRSKEIQTAIDTLREEIHNAEIKRTELVARASALQERAREAYGSEVDTTSGAESKETGGQGEEPPPTLDELEKRVEDIRRRLVSLGPVNLAAMEESSAEEDRLSFLQQQRQDLGDAGKNLRQVIVEINQTASAIFMKTFEEVRHRFKETFQNLFLGGEAEISLTDPSHPLESSIEIHARPEGKTLRSISLLSGGERALTATALLFGLYLVKPSPFCILDEVDAPLDDANVTRFIGLLQRLSSNTQFLVVTHNRRTMESADTLYGITMEEHGVSELVSVDLRAYAGDNGGDGSGSPEEDRAVIERVAG